MAVLLLLIGGCIGAAMTLVVARARQGRSEHSLAAAASVEPASDIPRNPDLERVQAALDNLSVGVVVADNTGSVVLRNRAAESAGGSRHGDVLVAEALEPLLRAAARGEEGRRTLELFGPPSRVLDINARPIEVGGAVATLLDVTERARLDAVRTDFVANISHELRTPIGAMSLLAEAMVDADDPEVIARLSAKIIKESERLARTIEDLLELSRIELGGDALREPVRAQFVLDDALERVRGFAERRQIPLRVEPADDDVQALGDRRQLVSALGNLMDNAIKYSDPGSVVEVRAFRDGDNVRFAVTDHGMGIGTQHLERIFERFYRVDRARSRETGGTGLGLAIVRHVANNHGGEVKVSSQEGEGSTFTLCIPAVPDSLSREGGTDRGPDSSAEHDR